MIAPLPFDVTNQDVQIFRRKKRSGFVFLAMSLAFTAVGIWLNDKGEWIGYLCAGFFGLASVVFVLNVLPGSCYLELTKDELRFANLFRVTQIAWSVINEFRVVTMRHNGIPVRKMVGFDFVPTYDQSKFMRRALSKIADCEGALPDTYGKSAEELAELLNACVATFTDHYEGPWCAD